MKEHICKYCGCLTTQPDEECYRYREPGMITSDRAKSIYKWILVILFAWLMSRISFAQVEEIATTWTYPEYDGVASTDLLSTGISKPVFHGDTLIIATQAVSTVGEFAAIWIPGQDSITRFKASTFQAAFTHNTFNYIIRGDSLFRFSQRSNGVSEIWYRSPLDGSSETALTAPTIGTNGYAGRLFMQNDTMFCPVSGSFQKTKWGSASWGSESYKSYSGSPVDNFKFDDDEDVFFVYTHYGLGSFSVSSGIYDSSFIAKRESTTGQLTFLELIDDSLSWRGGITGYTNGSGQKILYVYAQSPKKIGARIYKYNIDTDVITQIGDAATITGLTNSTVAINMISASEDGILWMSAGDIIDTNTTSSRIYRYSPGSGSWKRMESNPATALWSNTIGYAPFQIKAVGDSCFVHWTPSEILHEDSTTSHDPSSVSISGWLSASIELEVTYPNGGETFTSGEDTVTVTWTAAGVDSIYIYYSTNAGSSWILVDSTGESTYDWIVPDVLTSKGRIRLVDVFGAAEDQSDNSFSILPTGAAINILEPDGSTYTLSGNLLKILVESYLVDTLAFYFSTDGGSNYNLVSDEIPVGAGDGSPPDTTTYWWNASISLAQEIYYKVATAGDSNLVTGNPIAGQPYYDNDTLTNVGQRGRQQVAQGIYRWSNFFKLNDNLYTSGYFAFVWGWYDYYDAVYLFYWNTLTNSWSSVFFGAPGQAFYPGLRVYHLGSVPRMLMHNENYGISKTKECAWDVNLPPSLTLPLTAATEQTLSQAGISASTYPYQNDSTDSDGWRYYLYGDQVWAKDLVNTETTIDFYLLDLDSVTYLDGNRVEIFAYDSLLFISNSDHKGVLDPYGIPPLTIPPYEIVYTAPLLSAPYSFAYDITSTTIISGQYRAYFRGIYPEAILEMTSRK